MSDLDCRCGRPAPGASICRACTADLRKLLARTATLGGDLDVALTRQARVTVAGPGTSASDEQPLPYSVAASEALARLKALVGAWAAVVAPAGHAAPDTGRSAAVLLRRYALLVAQRLETVRQHPDAQGFLDALRAAVEFAVTVVDHPAVVVWVGTCRAPVVDRLDVDEGDVAVHECPGDLYANADDASVTCRVCGAVHDAVARRVALLAAAAEHHLTAAQAARAVKAYGVSTTPSRVRFMASDGLLAAVDVDQFGHPTYRLGDVLDALRRPPVPRTTRRNRKATA